MLVDLWATWCKPCKVSLPFYSELFEKHQKDGFRIMAVSVDEQVEDLSAYVDANPLPFTVLVDPNGSVPESVGVTQMPTMFLVGRDGRVAWMHAGFEDGDQEEIRKQVEEALAALPGPGETPK